MAAVEEPAGPTGMETLSCLTDDMKNTARKSTTKPAQLSDKVSSSSPSPVANGNVESPGDKHCVANGNGTHKRSVDQEDTSNPAKIARLHIEEMEKAQEEMTRKVTREEDNTVVAQNGDGVGEDSSHSQGDKSNDSNHSKQSSLSQHSRSSLALSADARNTFKGILDSAMAKVGPQRNSLNGPEPSGNDCKPSSVSSEDKPDQSMDVDITQQENGDSKQEVPSSQGVSDAEGEGTSEDTKSKDLASPEKETEQVVSESNDAKEITKDNKVTSDDTEEVTSKDDNVAKATSKDDDVAKSTSKDDDVAKVASKDDDVVKVTSKDDDVAKATSKDDDVKKATSDSHPLNDDALLEEDDPEDQAGDVDDAVLLSDDDKCDDKSPSDTVTNESGDKPDETQGDKIGDKSSDEKSKDESDSDKCTGSSEQNSKEAPDVEASPSVADKQENKTEKDTETSQSESDKDNATKDSSVEKDTSDSTEEKPTSDSNTDAAKESSESKTKKAKGFDIPEDKIISLSDDDGEEEKAQSDSKSEAKMDVNPDDPIEIEDEDDEDAEDDDKKSEASDLSLRKRGATSPIPSESSSTTKKSRLDKVIGRLGSAIAMKPDDDAPIDVDEIGDKEDEKAAESTEEKMDVDKVVIKDVTNEGAKDIKKDSNTDIKSEVKPDIKPDVDSKVEKTPSLSAGKKNITLTAEELNELLVKRMNAYLERSRGSLVVQLQTRISELQQAVESWRAQAKRLAKQLDEEVAKSSQRRQGKMVKQSRPNQLQAATMQQQGGGGGKVTIRGTPPRPTPQGIPTNVNAVPMRLSPAQVAAAQAKGTTVRDLLDKQRLNDPVGSKGQSVQIQGGRILVSGAQIGVRNGSLVSAGGPRPGTVVRTVHPPGTSAGGKSVIDLTDDDGGSGNTPPKIVRTAGGQQVAVRALGAAGTGAGRPGTVLVQQVPNSGGGPVLVQQVVTSQPLRTAGGTTYVYTTRPGSTLGMQTAPGTSLVRPAGMTTSTPPSLRPASQIVTLSRAAPGTNTLTRPPPPLRSAPTVVSTVNNTQVKHPAPLPPIPDTQPTHPKRPPPKPGLKISRVQSGIVLSWNMAVSDQAAQISSYQLFAYQETSAAPATSLWKKVGDVKALPLPMACTLTQFQEGNKYHFAVRAVDVHNRVGPFSEPSSIALTAINVS